MISNLVRRIRDAWAVGPLPVAEPGSRLTSRCTTPPAETTAPTLDRTVTTTPTGATA